MSAVDPAAAEQALEARRMFTAAAPVAPVPSDEAKAHYRAIIESHLAEKRQELKAARWRWGSTGLLGLSTACLAVALAYAVPLRSLLPVVVHQHEDGTWTTTVSQRDVPVRQRDATVKATLWLYVTANERYNTATHHEDQQVVYTLSDGPTGDAHQARVDARNKESPWKKYGTRTTVRLERVSESLGCGTEVCGPGQTPNSYAVRYRRIEKTEGQREAVTQRQSVARFHFPRKVPEGQVVTYNPAALQVVQYSWTEEGAAR